MSQSYNQIWIHAIWTTKEREPLIETGIEFQIYEYMQQQYTDFGCPVRIINGIPDHVHSLFLLNPKKPVMDVFKQVKGATSHWVNENKLIAEKFYWQSGYAAYSISESHVEKVFQYIKNQKIHHQYQTTTEELEVLNNRQGLVPG